MSLARVAFPDDLEQGAVRVMQLLLLGISVYGVIDGSFDLALNGFIPLLVTFLPAYLRSDYRVRMDTGLVFLLTLAALVHVVGVAGPYQNSPWYDEVAHSLSASVVAISGYAVVRALEIHSETLHLPGDFKQVFTVLTVAAFGGLWELFELLMGSAATAMGTEPPLIVYGLEDAVLDLIFNAVGGVIIAVVAPWAVSLLPRSIAARILDQ